MGKYRFSANKPRPNTPLDSIKFICKDLWTLLFRKQIDNLKTNHRGVFVLTDNRFQPLHRVSPDRRRGPKGVDEALSRAQAVREDSLNALESTCNLLGFCEMGDLLIETVPMVPVRRHSWCT